MVHKAIRWINLYPVDSAIGFLILIHWIAIYSVDSAVQLLNNRSQNFKIKSQKTSFRKGRRRENGDAPPRPKIWKERLLQVPREDVGQALFDAA